MALQKKLMDLYLFINEKAYLNIFLSKILYNVTLLHANNV